MPKKEIDLSAILSDSYVTPKPSSSKKEYDENNIDWDKYQGFTGISSGYTVLVEGFVDGKFISDALPHLTDKDTLQTDDVFNKDIHYYAEGMSEKWQLKRAILRLSEVTVH